MLSFKCNFLHFLNVNLLAANSSCKILLPCSFCLLQTLLLLNMNILVKHCTVALVFPISNMSALMAATPAIPLRLITYANMSQHQRSCSPWTHRQSLNAPAANYKLSWRVTIASVTPGPLFEHSLMRHVKWFNWSILLINLCAVDHPNCDCL